MFLAIYRLFWLNDPCISKIIVMERLLNVTKFRFLRLIEGLHDLSASLQSIIVKLVSAALPHLGKKPAPGFKPGAAVFIHIPGIFLLNPSHSAGAGWSHGPAGDGFPWRMRLYFE